MNPTGFLHRSSCRSHSVCRNPFRLKRFLSLVLSRVSVVAMVPETNSRDDAAAVAQSPLYWFRPYRIRKRLENLIPQPLSVKAGRRKARPSHLGRQRLRFFKSIEHSLAAPTASAPKRPPRGDPPALVSFVVGSWQTQPLVGSGAPDVIFHVFGWQS